MRPRHLLVIRGALTVVLVSAIVYLGWYTHESPARAFQGSNLLQNPGFEGTYVTVNGDSTLRVASGWNPWSLPQGDSSAENARPEYKPAPAERVRSGSAAQEYNTFFATHTGGVYQRVAVTPNTDMLFSIYVYVWSSASFENPNVSDNPNDVLVRVGIDPFGGTDGTSSRIIWSSDVEFYDQYRQLSVTTTARSSAVTVFVRSAPQGFVGTSNIYLDDAVLAPVGSAPPTDQPPGPTRTPPPTFTPDPDFIPTQEGTLTPLPTSNLPTSTPRPTLPPATRTPIPTVGPRPTNTPVVPDDFTTTVTHVVRAGDTVSQLASRYGSTIDAIASVNGLSNPGLIYVGQTLLIPVRGNPPQPAPPTFTPAPVNPGGGQQPQPGFVSYTIVRGDTLSTIAARFNTTVTTLAQVNNIVNPNLIYPGQVISVPGTAPVPTVPTLVPATPVPAQPPRPNTHVVQAGENLFRISLRYNVTLDALVRANGIYNAWLIYPGQVLVIP